VNDVWYDWPLILAYHSVSDRRRDDLSVPVQDFADQMEWLRRHGYRSMTLERYLARPPEKGERVVIITFDDGYADNHTHAFPVLQQHGFDATLFVVSDYVDSDEIFPWDRPKIDTDQGSELFRVVTWKQVEDMADYGIEIGSHSCSHPELPTLSADAALEELERSRRDISGRLLGRRVSSFCYPRGKLDDQVLALVKKAGYDCAVVTPTRGGIPLSRYTLRRVGVYHNAMPWRFRAKMQPVVRRNIERIKALASPG